MTQTDFNNFFERKVTEMRETLLKKGNDYAGDADRLDNFKAAAHICDIDPETTCLNLMAVKINRLSNLLTSSRTPNNESLEDTRKDLLCYAMLLNAIGEDKKQKQLTPKKDEND